MLYEWQPNFIYLRQAVEFLGSIFIRIWGIMCSPFIDEYNFSWAGGNYEPLYSYLLPVLAFGIAFSAIILLKKLISALVGGV